MTLRPNRRGGLLRDERGSVTLEASMVFPWVLIMTFAWILFSILAAQRALLYYSAAAGAERAAFTWSHSAKDIRTGAYPNGRYDGLYWRLADDAMLAGLFGWTAETEGVRVAIPAAATSTSGSTARDKLVKAAAGMPAGIQGTIGYRNRLWMRQVELHAAGQVLSPLVRLREGAGSSGEATIAAPVVEPAEWIRTFDLVRYYRAKLKSKGGKSGGYLQKAADVLRSR